MRYAEWKKLQNDPVVIRAQEALKMAQKELLKDLFWKDKVEHLGIFPACDRTQVIYLQVKDFAVVPMGRSPMMKRDIAWGAIANASPEEAMAIVLAEIYKFDLENGIGRS